MDPKVFSSLAQQAEAAEARLAQIESRLAATGAGGGLPPSALGELQELRSLLLQAQAERDALIAERDAALRATKAAEGEIAKLNYRVMHLMRAVR